MKRATMYWLRLLHGSGKTAVLVERIINKVINENVDIDKILVVTFTNAAASEMRERILDAIYKKLEENPDSINLQRQITLLNKASICTIHSFCLDVIRNNFYEIDTSANFRIGDSAEIEMLKSDVLDEILEQRYMENSEDFIKLLETYTDYRGDEKLQEIILNIYQFIQSNPFPEKWLMEKIEELNINENIDFADTVWGQILLDSKKHEIKDIILKLEKLKKETMKFPELDRNTAVLQEDIDNLKSILPIENWDKAYEAMNLVPWNKWPSNSKITLEIKEVAQKERTDLKKKFKESIDIKDTSEQACEDLRFMYNILKTLGELVLDFTKMFAEKKKERNMIDFNDIEHFALRILLNEKEEPTEVAKKYQEKWEEILVDEYQDSNLVQEKILTSISKGNNIFMVGDVKQSIYKFRQARPDLFLDKYEHYDLKNNLHENSKGLKIQLFKNFRSRKNILDITNLVFENIMSKNMGDVEYVEEEYLNYGADYPETEKNIEHAGIAELNIIDMKDDEEDTQSLDTENEERVEDVVLEARFVAKRIQKLLQSDYHVYDKKDKEYRQIQPKDICVLLRATSSLAPIYEKEISEIGYPVFSDSSSTYLDSMEVETILALLKVIDNPMQDIPLVTVLRSNIFGFTDNDLMQIRLVDRQCQFYEAMQKARISADNALRHKIDDTLEKIQNWRNEEKYIALDELIWKIYIDTGFYHYVSLLPNGGLRQANLKMLFEKSKQYEKASFKGLFNFIHFMDKIKTNNGDSTAAKIIGEKDDVVRIMSIHKSKGLEFPVVIIASCGKHFNMQDLNMPILLHQEIGFGPQFIDTERKIEYSSLAKEAIKKLVRKETISEEMRVFYVALTRAKEKLILVGRTRNLEKDLQDKEKMLEVYSDEQEISSEINNQASQLKLEKSLEQGGNVTEMTEQEDNQKQTRSENYKINPNLVGKYTSYLDWLELVYKYNQKNQLENVLEMHTYKRKDLLKELKEQKTDNKDFNKIIKEKAQKCGKDINVVNYIKWEYPYLTSSKIPTKTSVTKLKEIEQEEEQDIETLIAIAKNQEKQFTKLSSKPKFMEKVQSLNSAQKGTLIHLCVQKLDEKKDYAKEDIKKFVQELKERNILTEIESDSIDIDMLYKYTKSDLWKELKEAKEIHKEEPFYIYVPAKEIYEDAEESENILVQGIMDLYFVDKDGKLILVDYKTDYVPNGDVSILEEKYKLQLDLYKKALEQATGRKVDKAMIWALNR